MRLFGGGQWEVGAYVCPRGAFAIQCRQAAAGIEIERSLDVPFGLKTAEEAADHLVSVLQSAGITKATVSIALRGFGIAHHILQLPPASDAVLGPIIDREIRRLEPHLADCVVKWTALPSLDAPGSSAPPQRAFFAIAAPRDAIAAFESRLRAAGHRLAHVTGLPVAIQRLLDQFDSGTGTIATVAALPDGAYIGFSLGGGTRLIVEPPLPQNEQHESAALAEEVELAAMFVRQQFRGVHMDRAVIVGMRDSLSELKSALGERLKIPVKQLEIERLAPVGFVALGAVLDSRSAVPLSLGGNTKAKAATAARSAIEKASMAALFILALVGLWTITETVRTLRAANALESTQKRVEQDSFGLAPVRATAEQRRVVRDALSAVRMVAEERLALQQALAGIAAAMRRPARLDSLRLFHHDDGWMAVLGGTVESTSNARAVQALHDLYRELPQRVSVDSIRLERLTYADSTDDGTGALRFQLSVAMPPGKH